MESPLIACIVLAPLAGKPIVVADVRRLVNWPVCLLALTVVGIEIGYLLAYRTGWTLGITFAVSSVAAVTLLAVLGVAWFGEHVDGKRILGIVLALAGSWLIVA
jgi:multidrug transporter EmrE-like cation transporter